MNAQEMCKLYGGEGPCESTMFGEEEEADKLAALILQRKKRATASAYYWYESGEEKMPEPGALCVVLDSRNSAVCIIRTTRVYITEFRNVSSEHAALEGEGDLSLEYWKQEHRRFFTEDLAEAGRNFSEDMKVVCEEFEKVFPPDEPGFD